MWGIYINYGYPSEFQTLQNLRFDTKKEAIEWNNGKYPLKCIMKIVDILDIDPNYFNL